jgi:hypothetical protein
MLQTLIVLAQFHSLTPQSPGPIMPPIYSWEDRGQTSGNNPGMTTRGPAISNSGGGGGGGGGGSGGGGQSLHNDFGNMY